MDQLSIKKCLPCEIGTPPLKIGEIKKFLSLIDGWFLVDNKIVKDFKFKDFKKAMKFVNKVAVVAEKQGHHPDIFISYNKVILTLFTHFIKGLSENDFIVASKIDKIK